MKQHLPGYLAEHDKECAVRLVESLLKEPDLHITIDDGCGFVVSKSRDAARILRAMGSTGTDSVIVTKSDTDGSDIRLGSFFIVWGNDPGETITDHTDSTFCERHYKQANEPWADFVIVGPMDADDGRLYWSNNHGWVKRCDATIFAYNDKHLINPMGATGRESA